MAYVRHFCMSSFAYRHPLCWGVLSFAPFKTGLFDFFLFREFLVPSRASPLSHGRGLQCLLRGLACLFVVLTVYLTEQNFKFLMKSDLSACFLGWCCSRITKNFVPSPRSRKFLSPKSVTASWCTLRPMLFVARVHFLGVWMTDSAVCWRAHLFLWVPLHFCVNGLVCVGLVLRPLLGLLAWLSWKPQPHSRSQGCTVWVPQLHSSSQNCIVSPSKPKKFLLKILLALC